LQDLESSTRGYALTGETSFLDLHEHEVERLPMQFARLETLLPEDRESISQLRSLTAARMDFDERVIAARNSGGVELAIGIIETKEGMQITGQIREILDSLDRLQSERIQSLGTEATYWRLGGGIVLPLGILMGLVLIASALALLNMEAGRRVAEETRFRAIFNSTFQFIGLLKPDGTLIEANQTALDFGGLTSSDVINRPFWQALWWQINPSTSQELREAIAKAARGEFVRYNVDVQGRGGIVATIDFSLKPVFNDRREIVYLVPEGRDITELRRAQQALVESEERWNLALNGSDLGVWDWDARTNRVFFSDRWCTMLGYSPEEIRPDLSEWSSRVHPDDLEMAMKLVQDHLEGRSEAYVSEHRMQAKDGSYHWILDRGLVITRDEKGRACRVVGTHMDITDRKSSVVALEKALSEREVLLREIHHRVKNNLQVIASLLNLQARAMPALREAFEECRQRVVSMSLIHDQLYRHEDLAQIDFSDYVDSLTRLQRTAYGTPTARVSVAAEVTVPPLDIAMAVPCGLIVNELISNAYKHAFPGDRHGKIVIRLLDEGEEWVLTVEDDGVGNDAATAVEGTVSGLGLQLVAALARQLQGTLERHFDHGHCTTIRFPAPKPKLAMTS
jgi:PAS domain S-box-containing protein